jgi:hypothetical protein
MLKIHVKQASEVDDALTKAIEVGQKAAAKHRTGILVTRINAGKYIVLADPAGPKLVDVVHAIPPAEHKADENLLAYLIEPGRHTATHTNKDQREKFSHEQ